MRVLIVEDEPYMAEAIRDGLRLDAIAADIAGDGDTALGLPGINTYDIAVLDRRPACSRPPVREIAGLRPDPFRREVYRDGRHVALTRKQFAVLDVLVAAIIATVPGAGHRIDAQAEAGREGGDRG
ncbi:hypothetical protein ACFYTC_43275 [Actinomadura nitritigenes]|uniref:hypothetical protein n=1 Tax=Actinomadura nitritigenes TaxID=134602 RepID=UPI0036C08F96